MGTRRRRERPRRTTDGRGGHRSSGDSNMKFRCDRKAFLEVVGLLGGVTAGRGTRPILQHILIKAAGADLELLATDLEVALRCRHHPILIEEPGAACLPAGMLASI